MDKPNVRTVSLVVAGLIEMNGRAVALLPLTLEKFKELTVLVCEGLAEDIEFAAFEYTPQGPTLALWRRGTRAVQEIAANIGAYSIN